jgi:hypothetical protein
MGFFVDELLAGFSGDMFSMSMLADLAGHQLNALRRRLVPDCQSFADLITESKVMKPKPKHRSNIYGCKQT